MTTAPPERDVKDFKFHQLCKIRVSEAFELRTDRSQWLVASHKFDLVFVGVKDGFNVYKLSDICRVDEENSRERSTHVVENLDPWAKVNLNSPLSHLVLSCDEQTLSVVIKECGNLTLCAFDVNQFATKSCNAADFTRTRLNASPGANLTDITWNPADPTLLAVCVSDGSVELIKVTDKIQIVGSLPVSTGACCFCWSPKGRQLVVAKKDGTMTQYDQEMKEKRQWPSPSILDTQHQVVDVTWLSTYVFLASYISVTADQSDQPVVILTSSSKEGPATYVNFEDVCYGSGEERKHKYFFTFLSKWDMVLLSSNNATETTIIAKHLDQDPGQWEHWTLEDSGRSELPLTDSHNDSFPVGVTVSLACQTPVKLGENKSIPPCPVMLLLSTDGMLVPFYMVYLNAKAAILTVPPEQLKPGQARAAAPAVGQASVSAMPGFGFGAPKQGGTTLGLGSTLPTTGNSFQFVQKTTPTPQSLAPGGSLLAQSLTSSPASAPSFQFATKPPQQSTAQAGSVFTPVGSQANAFASSDGQKFAFTPTATSGSFPTTPVAKTTTAPPITKPNQFGSTPGSFSFGTKQGSDTLSSDATKETPIALTSEAAKQSTTFGFNTTPAKTSTSEAPKTGFTSLGFNTESAKTSTPSAFVGSPFTKPATAVATSTTTASASTFGGLNLGGTTGLPGTGIAKNIEVPTPAFPTSAPLVTPQNVAQPIPQSTLPQPSMPKPSLPQPTIPQPASLSKPTGSKREVEEDTGQEQGEPWVNKTVESTFTKSIIEEMHHFEQELKELKSRAGSGKTVVGTKEEIRSLRQQTLDMSQFCQNVKATTKDQSREVHDQKVLCLDLFAMAEECRVRQERNDDPHYHQLLRSRSLDPTSSEKLKQLQSQHQVLEQGLSEVEHVLDQQWEEFQDRKKAVKGRLQAPTSDMIYRAVKSNHNLIQTQKTQLDSLQEKLKNLQLYNKSSDWHNSSSLTPNISRSADLSSLVSALSPSGPGPRPLRSSSMIVTSPGKKAQLRDFLSQRQVPRIKSTKPGSLSMSQIVANKGLREKLDEVRSRSMSQKSSGDDTEQTIPMRTQFSQAEVAPMFAQSKKLTQNIQTDISTRPTSAIQPHMGTRKPLDVPSVKQTPPVQQDVQTPAVQQMPAEKEPQTIQDDYQGFRSGLPEIPGQLKNTQVSHFSQPHVEDISPAFTPELGSEVDEEYQEYEEDEVSTEDEEEAGFGFGAEYVQEVEEEPEAATTPLSGQTEKKAGGVGKNLFGAPTSSSATGFAEDTSSSKSADSTSQGTAAKPDLKGFSFGSKPAADDKSSAPGFSFNTTPGSTAGTDGFKFSSTAAASVSSTIGSKFGQGTGIFAKSTESSEASKTLSAFGGGGFGGSSSSSVLQALAQSSAPATSQSTTVSAALGSSLLAALADASTPAPQEAAAALSSFSFKPGETPSPQPKTDTAAPAVTTSTSAGDVSQSMTAKTEAGGFGQPAKFSGSPPGVTAAAAASTSASTSTSATSVFGSTSGVFGSAGASSFGGFSTPTQASTATTASTSTSSSVVKSLFGASSTTSTAPSSFGGSTGGFGTTGGLFGKLSTSETTASNVGTSSNTTTTASGFGTTATTTAAFGTTTTTLGTTTSGGMTGLFGSSSSSTSAFGQATKPAPATTTTAASSTSLFGGATSTTSLFGAATTTTAPSGFGGTASGIFSSTPATTSASAFGSSTTATTTASGFGFGQPAAGFGQAAFGQSAGFGQTSSFGGSAGSTGFGSGGTAFGQSTATTSASAFGQSTTPTQSSEGGLFGGGGGGGGLFGGLGGKPSAEKANTNVFGGGNFGTATSSQQSNLFGSTAPASTFGGVPQSGFGSPGGFSSASSGVGSSGFGVTATAPSPQTTGGFGSQPAFGGSPAFGSSTFGGGPSFGSPTAPTGGFGSQPTFGSAGNAGQAGGFASFASGNSPTFGNIAQTSQPSFGSMTGQNTGGGGGGGFGSPSGFGSPAPSGFGQQPPAFGGGGQPQASFGSSPQFTSYRG